MAVLAHPQQPTWRGKAGRPRPLLLRVPPTASAIQAAPEAAPARSRALHVAEDPRQASPREGGAVCRWA